MIDMLLTYSSESAAQNALPRFWNGHWWDFPTCIPNVTAYDSRVNTDIKVPITPLDSNWRLIVMLEDEDTSVINLTECHLALRREDNTIIKNVLTQDQFDNLRLDRVPAGSNYPFGGG